MATITLRLPSAHCGHNEDWETVRLPGISLPSPPYDPYHQTRTTRRVHRTPLSHRAARLGLLVIVLFTIAAVGSRAAIAKSTASCANQVIADWYDDGRVGKIYPLQCYAAAIAKLPPDVRDYSNAKEEINRALAFAKQGKPDPGGSDPTPTGTTNTTTTTTTGGVGTGKTTTGTSSVTTGTATSGFTGATDTGTTDTSGPSSVPVPLLVLGGLAILLLAAGSAGYLRRRMNGGGEGDGTPPPAV